MVVSIYEGSLSQDPLSSNDYTSLGFQFLHILGKNSLNLFLYSSNTSIPPAKIGDSVSWFLQLYISTAVNNFLPSSHWPVQNFAFIKSHFLFYQGEFPQQPNQK